MHAFVIALGWSLGWGLAADDTVTISPAERLPDGTRVHKVSSSHQAGETLLRVVLPDGAESRPRKLPVVYVLPVEARDEQRFGSGLEEVRRHDLANKHQAVFVLPTFSHLPWYVDHATDGRIRQETYFVDVVVPAIEERYPVSREAAGRLLAGFSKSGWGACSLVLRHPDRFGRAAAWDAPLVMDRPQYGLAEIAGSAEVFEQYRLDRAFERHAERVRTGRRFVLLGYGNFREHHEQAHRLLERLGITHVHRNDTKRKHDWHSGWLAEAVELLFGTRRNDE